MNRICVSVLLSIGLLLGATAAAWSADQTAFGTIKAPTLDQARAQLFTWVKELKANPATVAKIDALWEPSLDRALLDRMAESIALVHADAGRLVQSVRDGSSPAPVDVPALLKDPQLPAFVRGNLGLYAAKHLATRRVNDEAFVILQGIRPEQVVDPASYYFFKAVTANRLLLKDEGLQAVDRLLNSVSDAPERYTVLAGLMKEEMRTWKDQDLGYIARRMEEIEGRLQIARGGPKTQEKQKEVIDLLDQKIKEMEQALQQMMQQAQASNAQRSSSPLPDSRIMGGAGPGNVDKKKLLKLAEAWGKLPEKDKIKALEAISRDYPPHFREAIEGYLKKTIEGMAKESSR